VRRRSRTVGPASGERGVETEALGALGRRPLSVARLADRLRASGHAPEEVERVCARLSASGHLDDRRFAEHWLVTRAERLGHGPERLRADLEREGVPAMLVAEVWRDLVARGDLDPAAMLARKLRRLRGAGDGPLGRRGTARVYNALLRAGFPADDVERALGAADDTDGGSDDDVP
jgi:regulatory protein